MRTTALWSIILVILIGHIGTAMPYPIFAPLFIGTQSDIAQSTVLSPILLFSLLMAIYPLGTLIGSVYLGQISDRIGRKNVIFGTLLLAAGTNLLSGYAVVIEHYVLLFTARFLTGVCEGNISVARAVLTDLDLKAADKAVAFGYLSSAGYTGYLVGPLLGGYLSYVHFSAPFFLAAALCILAAVSCMAYMPETRPTAKFPADQHTPSFWKAPRLKIFLAIQFLITLTINIYHEFFPALMVDKWDATPQQISYATIIATTTMITLSVFGMRPILGKWNAGQLYFYSMLMLGFSVVLFTLPQQLLAIYPVFIVFGVSLAVFNSTSNTWLSDTYANVGQGRLMGVIASMFFLSNIIAAALGGIVANFSIMAVMAIGSAIAIISSLAFKIAARPRASRAHGRDLGSLGGQPQLVILDAFSLGYPGSPAGRRPRWRGPAPASAPPHLYARMEIALTRESLVSGRRAPQLARAHSIAPAERGIQGTRGREPGRVPQLGDGHVPIRRAAQPIFDQPQPFLADQQGSGVFRSRPFMSGRSVMG